MAKVVITDYKWAGKWLFLRIKTKCEECDTNTAILKDMMKKEFKKKDVKLEIKPWLNNWFEAWVRSGFRAWHAPIILVNNKLFAQGRVIDRKKLAKTVLDELTN